MSSAEVGSATSAAAHDEKDRASSAWPWALNLLGVPMACVLLLVVVITPLELRAQIWFGAIVFAAAVVVGRFKGAGVDLFLVLLSVLVSARYIFWRVTMTMPGELSWDLLAGGALLLAELYAFAVLLLGYFQTVRPMRRRPLPLPTSEEQWPVVDVFIPTYNEPLKVVRATALAAKSIDWPTDKLRVHILDDGGRSTGWKTEAQRLRAAERNKAFSSFCRDVDVEYHTRPDNSHAKAGNLNHALSKTSGEFVVIFDCDHCPTRSFLQMTMGWMVADPRLALLQTPHHFYSPDPIERNLGRFKTQPNEGELFYGLIQPGNDLWDATFFCGSCAVIRRAPLEDVGGIAVETVTEDAHTALKMQRKGWSTAYVDIPQAAGLATESLSAHVGQRIRWARGMAQIFRVDNPLLGRGLKGSQRLCYLSAMLYFFYGIPRLVFLLAPLSFLFFDLQIIQAGPLLVLAHALPHLAHSITTNSRLQGRFRASMWSEVYEVLLATYIVLPTTLALIAPKLGRFNVTSKGGVVPERYFDRVIAKPYLLLAALNLGGMVAGLARAQLGDPNPDVVLFNVLWSTYNLLILLAASSVAWESRQLRSNPRVEACLPAWLRHCGHLHETQTLDLALGGLGVALPAGLDVALGDEVRVSVEVDGERTGASARVVAVGPDRLGLELSEGQLEAELGVVRAAFSRADAWTRWGEGRRPDRPLLALLDIWRVGLSSLAELPRGLLARTPSGTSS